MKTINDYTISARWLITEAFMALLVASTFEKITVNAIVRKAGISRSTFYLHFQDKFDLLDKVTHEIVSELKEIFDGEWNQEFDEQLKEVSDNQSPLPITIELLEHIRHYNHFYRDRYRDSSFVIQLSELLCTRLKTVFQDETLAFFLAYGTIGFIGSWLNQGLKGSTTEVALRLTNIALFSLPQVRDKPIKR